MLTYTLSRREKALILGLAVILLVLAWFMLVYQRTTDEMTRLDGQISTVQSEMTLATAKAGRMSAMQKVIDESKQAGISPKPVPDFDNMTPLMTELNAIMGATSNYTLAFDALDRETSAEYVLRGVRADFSCDTVPQAEAVVSALEGGVFPCSIDSVTIADHTAGGTSRTLGVRGSSAVSATVHVTFFERA